MKTPLLTLFTILNLMIAAQNWVPNYSFENYNQCPTTYNQVGYCQNWLPSPVNNVPQYHTEYLHACNTGSFSVPTSTWGSQAAVTGQGYMALCTMAPAVTLNYRENIYVPLVAPMSIGQTYHVSFRVSHTDNSQYATNNIGAKFSTVPNISVNNFAHVNSTSQVTDKLNWVTISGSFVADSAYTYLGIGNFYTDANTVSSNICSSCSFSQYGYFIDDVCVFRETIGNCAIQFSPASVEESVASAFRPLTAYPNPSPKGTELVLSGPDIPFGSNQVTILDIAGKIVGELRTVQSGNNSTVSTAEMQGGVYFIRLQSEDRVWMGKVILY